MKIAISYPPFGSGRHATLGQNRQFQWFHNPSFIYPMVPAYAATMLKNIGHEVVWNDAISARWEPERYWSFLCKEVPELIAIETKTPVVALHWEMIREIRRLLSGSIVVMYGDHVTALPEESMRNCPVDYVLTGGDYDFLLLNLVEHLSGKADLEPGIWYRSSGEIRNTGGFLLNHDLDNLPQIDRELTSWRSYGEHLFIESPNTYMMAGRDCWYGRCTFCSWTTLFPRFRVRSEQLVLDEIENLVSTYDIREIFDDTGTFPTGAWLDRFCSGLKDRGLSKSLRISCNARVNGFSEDQLRMMRASGFRLLKYGLESANQQTLDRLRKGTTVEEIVNGCRAAKRAGLTVHLTTMVGYPWESREDALRTVDLAKTLLRRGDADMLQATIVIPYPGTPLFAEAKANGWLLTENWSDYDMGQPVLESPIPADELHSLTQGLYKAFLSPAFIGRTILSIRTIDDLKFIGRAGKAVLGHLRDFTRR